MNYKEKQMKLKHLEIDVRIMKAKQWLDYCKPEPVVIPLPPKKLTWKWWK